MPLGFFEEEDARRIARHVKLNEGKSAVRRNRPRRRAIQNAGQSCKIGRPTAAVAVGALGTFRIYRRPEPGQPPVDTGETEEAWHDWMTGGIALPAGVDSKLTFFADEGVWRVVNAEYECEEP